MTFFELLCACWALRLQVITHFQCLFTVPSFEYTSLEQLDVSGLRAFGKRPPTFLQYRLRVNGQSITINLKPNTEVIAPGNIYYQRERERERERERDRNRERNRERLLCKVKRYHSFIIYIYLENEKTK